MAESSGGSVLQSMTWQCLDCQERMENVPTRLTPQCCMFCQSQNIQTERSLDVPPPQKVQRDPLSCNISLKTEPDICTPHAGNSVTNVGVNNALQDQSEQPQLKCTSKAVASDVSCENNSGPGTQTEPESKLTEHETKDSPGTMSTLQTPDTSSSAKSEASKTDLSVPKPAVTSQANGTNGSHLPSQPINGSIGTESKGIESNEQNESMKDGSIVQRSQSEHILNGTNIEAPENHLPQADSANRSKLESETKNASAHNTQEGSGSSQSRPDGTSEHLGPTHPDYTAGHASTATSFVQNRNENSSSGHIRVAEVIKVSAAEPLATGETISSVDLPESSSLKHDSERTENISCKAEGNGSHEFQQKTYAQITETENRERNDLGVQGQVRGEEVVAHRKPEFSDQEKLFGGTKPAEHRAEDRSTSSTDCETPSRPRLDLSGLDPTNRPCCTVTFYAFLPLEAWSWTEESHVGLRFGHQRLGDWKCDVGRFTMTREVDSGLWEIQCTLRIDASILFGQRSVPYKYVVHSPNRTGEDQVPHEFLHGAHGGGQIVNRCLFVPLDRFQAGTHHQFDNMIYPQTKTKSGFRAGFNKLKGMIGSSQKKDAPTVPEHEAMQEQSLLAYLDNNKLMLVNCELSSVNVLTILSLKNGILKLFDQLHKQRTHHHEHRDVWTANRLPQVLKGWLASIIKELKTKVVSTYEENGKRMASVLTVLTCLHHLTSKNLVPFRDVSLKVIAASLQMLALKPDFEQKRCHDLEFILSMIPEKVRGDVADVVTFFCAHLVEFKDFQSPEWLFAVPLIDFLKRLSKPFQRLEINPSEIPWKASYQSLGLWHLWRKCSSRNCGVVEKCFDDLKPLTVVDPLFLPMFVLACPLPELPLLFHQIQPYVAVSWTSVLLGQIQGSLSKNEAKQFTTFITAALNVLQTQSKEEILESNTLESACEASEMLLQVVVRKVAERDEQYLNVLKVALSFALYSLDCFEEHVVSSEQEIVKYFVEERLDKVTTELSKWISRIWSVSFGTPRNGAFNPEHARKEIKVWKSLLLIECPRRYQDKWQHTIVYGIVSSRVGNIRYDSHRIDLLCMLQADKDQNDILFEVFLKAATLSLERMAKEGGRDTSAQVEKLYSTATRKREIGDLLGTLIRRRYPEGKQVTLEELLGWSLWPTFIKIFRSEGLAIKESRDRLQSCLPDDCDLLCTCAESMLDELCSHIRDGRITMRELERIAKKRDQIERLSSVAVAASKAASKLFMESFDERVRQYNAFGRCQEQLKYLCREVTVRVNGLEELKQQLNSNYNDVAIKEVCRFDGKTFVHCFVTANVLTPILRQFEYVCHVHPSEVFRQIWLERMRTAEYSKGVLEIHDIIVEIWNPALRECSQLIESLHTCTIVLEDVDKYFGDIEPDNLYKVIQNLAGGVDLCRFDRSESFSNASWIHRCVQLISDYRTLCQCSQAATTLLDLRKELNLTGDFQLIETLAATVTSSMKNVPLVAINRKLVDAGNFVREIAIPEKLFCLKVFAQCSKLVEWIRKETKEVADLHNFVSVALHTVAGEGDFDRDRLSNLKIAGSGFASLIYGLRVDTSFVAFQRACKAVWFQLARTYNLAGILKSCDTELEWYRSIRQSQGSVENNSYSQMRNIMTYGCYQVGSQSSEILQTLHSAVHMTLTVPALVRVPKKKYNLDELRDLESKLVLITNSKAENRQAVDHFTNTLQSITQIGDVLLALQQAGNVRYTGWLLEVPCGMDVNIDMLQEQAKRMEEELQCWLQEMKHKRGCFNQLNYFTTLQLLMLRKELGTMRLKANPSPADIGVSVLPMLQGVSSHVTARNVFDVVQRVTSPGFKVRPQKETKEVPGTQKVAKPAIELSIVTTSAQAEVKMTKRQPTSPETVSSVDTPSLDVCDLTESEKEMLTTIVTRLGYHKLLVLKALELHRNKEEVDKYDIQRWCVENADKYSFHTDLSDEEWESDIDSDENASLSEMEYSDDSFVSACENPLHGVAKAKLVPSIPTASQERVDRYHPIVKELVSAGYSVDRSIVAVRNCKTCEAALEYLDNEQMIDSESSQHGIFPTVATSSQETQLWTAPPSSQKSLPLTPSVAVSSPVIRANEDAEGSYLTLDELGSALEVLSGSLPPLVSSKRKFDLRLLQCGSPNLIITAPANILKSALALYMNDENLPLPTLEEVLLCNRNTTVEEVSLLWQRAVNDSPDYNRIFCLLHAEELPYQVADNGLQLLSDITQGKSGYRLVVICSNVDEEKSHIISKLSLFRRPFIQMHHEEKYKKYLKNHMVFGSKSIASGQSMQSMDSLGITVDHENSSVRVVSSARSGMGKSLFIKRMAAKLKNENKGSDHVTIPLHGPVVTPVSVLNYLIKHIKKPLCTLYHIDVSQSILWQMDSILFSLLILRGLNDSQGRTWRCHPCQMYVVEVTLPDTQDEKVNPGECETLALLRLLPRVHCLSPRLSLFLMNSGPKDASQIVMDQIEFESAAFQRVYQYLRRHTLKKSLDKFSFKDHVEGNPADCLKVILSKCGVQNPSWAEIKHFTEFLNIQLHSCELSVFCDESLVGDIMSGLKGFVVKFMMLMSRDFATSSLLGEVARDELQESVERGENSLEQYQIAPRREWEQNSHPYIFFNHDGMSITFVGFMVNKSGDLIDPVHHKVIEANVMTTKLYTGLEQNRVNFNDDHRTWSKKDMMNKIATVMGMTTFSDPDKSYVLTVDNVIKILAIQMRFRCGIPVIIMGETGCGKTRLIRYMCDFTRQNQKGRNMLIMKVHGGTTEKDIAKFVCNAEKEVLLNRKHGMHTVVFFDEANTTDAIGLIKEVICDRRLHGKPVSDDLKFIAACNPYRRHSKEMIKKLENAGLGFCVLSTETQQKLGKIPLRELVYRVLELPASMRPLVYDFGQLNTGTEYEYVQQIVKDHLRNLTGHSQLTSFIPAVTKVLVWSQSYMRKSQDECSFVSLRDVERAMIVFEYFLENMDRFAPEMDRINPPGNSSRKRQVERYKSPDNVTRSLILSVSVCYHTRLLKRNGFEDGVSRKFVPPLALPGGADQFRDEIWRSQEMLLTSMKLGENIARNAALRENVFMMAICIELRIPLFLIGKPGSSKSLAKAIISDSMRGKDSRNDLLKGFKEVVIFSYQCSQLSTPEGVIEVFKNAQKFQDQQKGNTSYVSVVVLDEVGLAEDSPNLPLKALHPLLEDGTEGANDSQQIIERQKRVAFIGISNWALDPAKMNRGVMVTRSDPGVAELEFSAKGICSNKVNDPVRGRLEPYFRPLAEAYIEICENQHREFFGLRDFYSLIKMLYWMCEKSGRPPTWPQLLHAIKRNFGGLKIGGQDPIQLFERRLPGSRNLPDLTDIKPHLHEVVSPDCSELGLIRTSLRGKERTWHGENRYLLFLTENYAALHILKHYLSDACSTTTESFGGSNEPFILFGSSFPKDKEYTQVCRNINQIKLCMETGRTVILLNLENLYESLYDVLNQYYIYSAGNRYVDLGLQTNRVRCKVHDNFKLILIAEEDTVYKTFPTPLINRLEKHFVLTSSVLMKWQQEIVFAFEKWIQLFSNTGVSSFTAGNAFVGYQRDTPAAIVFQADKQLKRIKEKPERIQQWKMTTRMWTLKTMSPDLLSDEDDDSHLWRHIVLRLSQYLLLQMASPDALIRLDKTDLAGERDDLSKLYFESQCHQSIHDFLLHYTAGTVSEGGLLMQVTTHSHILSLIEIKQIEEKVKIKTDAYFLNEFETELDFSNKVRRSLSCESGPLLLIIQCDSGYLYADLIACARYRIFDERARIPNQINTHVLFIINVPRHVVNSTFVGFQGEPWLSYHIDDLRPSLNTSVLPHQAVEASLSQIFIGSLTPAPSVGASAEQELLVGQSRGEGRTLRNADGEAPVGDKQLEVDERVHHKCLELAETVLVVQSEPVAHPHVPPQYQRLYSCIQAAASKCQQFTTHKRATRRVEILLKLIPQVPTFPPDLTKFDGILINHVYRLLCERDKVFTHEKEWVLNEAMSSKRLQNGGTFRNVLNRKVDEVVIPIFSDIIGVIDKNANLDLVVSKTDMSRHHFWLDMFRDPEVMMFSFRDVSTRRLGAEGVTGPDDLKCQLPFSWLIGDVINNHWDNLKTVGDDLHNQLVQAVLQTPVGDVLQRVPEEDCERFYKYYLHDFVRRVHICKHRQTVTQDDLENLEYEEVEKALDVMTQDPSFFLAEHSVSLVNRLTALHVVYKHNSQQIILFGQLVSLNPGVLLYLKGRMAPTLSSEIAVHLYALEKMLEELSPPFEKDNPETDLLPWLNDIRISQNSVNSVLLLPSQSELVNRLRLKWQLIRATQMYIEHVIMKHPEVHIMYARRLYLHLKRSSDFLKAETLKIVKQQLNQMDIELHRDTQSITHSELRAIRKSCKAFFIELVSTLCFGAQSAPEPDLIKILMDTVFTKREDSESLVMRDLTPFDSKRQHSAVETSGEVCMVRSFLLQLLLEHSFDAVRDHLDEYFRNSCTVLSTKQVDQNLCLLVIRCFEDSYLKTYTVHSINASLMEDATYLLSKGYAALKNFVVDRVITLQYLEGIAQIRFGVSIAARCIEKDVNTSAVGYSVVERESFLKLLETAHRVCTNSELNFVDVYGSKDSVGPIVYLLKLLGRQYLFSCLNSAVERYHWIMPPSLRAVINEREKIRDPFIVYESLGYANVRQCVSEAMHGNDRQKLMETLKDMPSQQVAVMLPALYVTVTLSRALPSVQVLPDAILQLNDCIMQSRVLSAEVKHAAKLLIANQQGGTLGQMSISHHHPQHYVNLGAIVVHTVGVVLCRNKIGVLLPLLNMLTKPKQLNGAYLPTMQEDYLQEAKGILQSRGQGAFYECPRGHPYFVGDCGRPVIESNCPICGDRIGGVGHVLRSDNMAAPTRDTTKTGHILGSPEGRTGVPASERSLSPPAVCVVRALMHSALVWACCTNDSGSVLQDISQLVHPHIPCGLAEFFWRHLEKDIEQLGIATGRGMDESAMIIHLVLKEILTKEPLVGAGKTMNSLQARSSREEWEKSFSDQYIQPVLEKLGVKLDRALQQMLKDKSRERDQMFYLVYERGNVRSDSLEPHLWTYRTHVSLGHLGQTLQHGKMKERYPLLHMFLKVEPVLRATRYLPDIVKLQHSLFNLFHRRAGKENAKDQTIGSFFKGIKSENTRNQFREWFKGVQIAWSLVGHKLANHGRLPVEERYLKLWPALTLDTPLEYLIPTTTEAGVCTTSLVDFLVLSHNDFIEFCINKGEKDTMSLAFWKGHKVPIICVQQCHLLDYEQQVLSIVLSHCHYSLTFGKGHSVSYDHQALEKHIMNRFVYGKPLILSDIPQVVYRRDVYTAVTFASIRKKVKPQEQLQKRLQQEIVSELRTPDRLRDTLDVVDIVLAFLSSGGGRADKNLGEYVDKVLKMSDRAISRKAKEFCSLGHIISLWEVLSVEHAVQLYLRKEDPFDSLNDQYLRDLTTGVGEKNQKQDLEKSLSVFDLSRLLGILYEFIETFVKYSLTNELRYPLQDSLVAYLEQNDLPVMAELAHSGSLPVSITLDQAVATWKYIVDYKVRQM